MKHPVRSRATCIASGDDITDDLVVGCTVVTVGACQLADIGESSRRLRHSQTVEGVGAHRGHIVHVRHHHRQDIVS